MQLLFIMYGYLNLQMAHYNTVTIMCDYTWEGVWTGDSVYWPLNHLHTHNSWLHFIDLAISWQQLVLQEL
jgi:hypothetical protein